MARYPTFPTRFIDTSDEELRELYTTLETWSGLLTSELETRDVDVDAAPATNIYTVVTLSEIGRPRKGDIAYAASAGKYKGYVSLGSETSWQDLN
jgi:hypothetical protein|tara:strand:+ start:3152 stop:3436 length:285 start_codon:yes stop_codon:yes gene_type:complete